MKINNRLKPYASTLILKTENKKSTTAFQGDYHVKPAYPVALKGDMYYMLMPKSAPIALGKKPPAWLQKIELINNILDETENPEQVKMHMDLLMSAANIGNNSSIQKIDTEKIKEVADTIENKEELSALLEIFNIEHKYELKSSTNGGSLPSSLCTQMKMYEAIKNVLKEKIETT
jgi:hypothetical protein